MEEDSVVRLRGLPWSTKPEEIIKFLEGALGATFAPSVRYHHHHYHLSLALDSGGATPGHARSNDLAERSTALVPPCLLLCFGNSVNGKFKCYHI